MIEKIKGVLLWEGKKFPLLVEVDAGETTGEDPAEIGYAFGSLTVNHFLNKI